jgi:hypothetical protein
MNLVDAAKRFTRIPKSIGFSSVAGSEAHVFYAWGHGDNRRDAPLAKNPVKSG